jgi:hypothetical protein
MSSKPKPWIAVVLSIIFAPLAFLYTGRLRWALAFFASALAIAIADFLRVLGAGVSADIATPAQPCAGVALRFAKAIPSLRISKAHEK